VPFLSTEYPTVNTMMQGFLQLDLEMDSATTRLGNKGVVLRSPYANKNG